MTPSQARDAALEGVALHLDAVRALRNAALDCTADRAADTAGTYLQCPRCKGWHSIHGNFGDLCDGCQRTILEHFPEHESAPHIRAALARWKST